MHDSINSAECEISRTGPIQVGLPLQSFSKIASEKRGHAFAGGVPMGTGAQPTGENFHLKIFGPAPYQGGVCC